MESSGFYVDPAVFDPGREGKFLLAVECVGARYQSSGWALERDCLRRLVLEQEGWRLHRIWSTDWFYTRTVEMRMFLGRDRAVRTCPGTGAESTLCTESRSSSEKRLPHSRIYGISTAALAGAGERVLALRGTIRVKEAGRRVSRLRVASEQGSGSGRLARTRYDVQSLAEEFDTPAQIRIDSSAVPTS